MKNHTKQVLSIFLAVLLVSSLSGFALADVIWEPEDDFYSAHASECEYVNASYYSNGSTGYLEVFDKPSGVGVGFADNGLLFYVSFVYTDNGEDWGVVEYIKKNDRLLPTDYTKDSGTGWIRLSETVAKYGSAEFAADHASSIKTFEGDASPLLELTSIATWTYPNSGESAGDIKVEYVNPDFADAFSTCYTDEAGQEWVFCGYYHGFRNFWICLSDPENTELPPVNTPVLDIIKPQSDKLPEATGSTMTTTIIICVAAAVIISAGLIIGLRKKNGDADTAK